MKPEAVIMSDAEVAKLFRISLCTLQRRMRDGFPDGELDIGKGATHYMLGGRRWWVRDSVEALARRAAA